MSCPVGKTFTLEDALQTIGMGWYQIKLLVLLLCFHMADAMETMFLSVIPGSLKCKWNSPSWELALTTTVVFLGTCLAAPIWGRLSDVYGRRPILFSSASWVAYFGFLSAFSPSMLWFLILRFLTGAGFPGSYLAFVTLSEFVPQKHKAWTLILYQLSWPIGSCLETGLAAIILPHQSWRILVGITALPVLLTALSIKFVPESPQYSLVSGKQKEVMKLLHKIAVVNGGTVPEGTLIPEFQKHRGRVKDLFANKKLAHATVQLWCLVFNQSFIYYGIVLLFSEMIRTHYSACDNSKGGLIEEPCNCEFHDWLYYKPHMVSSSGEFVACLFNLTLLDWIGRKKTIIVHFCSMGIMILLLLLCISDTSRDIILFFIRAFSQSTYTALTIYITEIYPTEIRSIGYGLCTATLRMGAMLTPFCSQVLSEYSFPLAISIYGVLSILCGLSSILLPFETKPSSLPSKFCKK